VSLATTTDRPLPRASRWVLAAGMALAATGIAVVSALMLHERTEVVAAQRDRAELLARVLEDHATRSIESASLAVATLAELVVRVGPREEAVVRAALSQTLANLPFLRGVAVVAPDGRVLFGSDGGDRGEPVDLSGLGPLPEVDRDALGPFVPGRRLQDLRRGQPVSAPAGLGFIPLVRTAAGPAGPLHVVALINPDAFANFQEVILKDTDAAAAMLSYDARLLTSTASVGLPSGESLRRLPPFARYLPATENASWVGEGMRAGEQIAAFRVLRVRPLVVMVEFDRDLLLQGWLRQRIGFLAVAGAAVLITLAMAGAAASGLRAREGARAERDLAQAAVAERERELSAIFSSVQELLLRTDAQGIVTFINARWQALSGQPGEAAVGRALADLVLPESAPAVKSLFGNPADSRARQALVQTTGPEGQTVWLALALVPLQDAQGGYAGSAMDVTDVQAAQAALKSQLMFTDSLLETNPLPVSVLDTQGRYLRVNRAWEDFFGRQRDKVIGTPAGSYYPPEEAAQHGAQDRELLAGRAARLRYEASFARPDGRLHELLVTKSLVRGPSGRPEAIVCTFMDISEFREAERATREARDAAEEASRVKSEFIANISHELRTPLQSILGFSELGYTRGREHTKLAGMFEDIHRAGRRMLALVNDLLDVSKIESTVGSIVRERTDLDRLLREAVAELSPLCTPRGLRIDTELPAEPLHASVDPLRLQQVVRNVLANAIRFSPEGGRIELAAGVDGDGIHIRVADHGPGIPPAELERIFEAFVQSSKTKDGAGGTGLGLAICRKIMQAHGGTIHAENRDGGGSVFHIRLPQGAQ